MKWTTTHKLTVINIVVAIFGIFYNGKTTIEIKEIRDEIEANKAIIEEIIAKSIRTDELQTEACPYGTFSQARMDPSNGFIVECVAY